MTRARPGDGVECRICLMEDGDDFVSPCNCIGTLRHVHAGCLARWCRETGVTTCELCHGHFPARFIDAGKGVRLERELAERARLEAHERLERLAANFEAAYGRPPRTPTDFAVINLNSVLEGEAEARRRANTLDPETRDRLGPGAEVVVIDAGGRAQTLNTRDIGPRGFVERLLLSELERAESLSASASARRAGGPEETFGFDAAFALDDRYGDPLSLSGDPYSDALDRRARAASRLARASSISSAAANALSSSLRAIANASFTRRSSVSSRRRLYTYAARPIRTSGRVNPTSLRMNCGYAPPAPSPAATTTTTT